MNRADEHVNSEPLLPAASDEEYALHLAAVEWSLAQPTILAGAADIKSRNLWQNGFEPHEHQIQNLLTFCQRLPVLLLADEAGLGKTVSACLIVAEMLARQRIRRVLVICPPILARQWEEELETKFGIASVFAKGPEFEDCCNQAGPPVVITTYEIARSRIHKLKNSDFDFLILDEAQKLRNLHGTPKQPEVTTRIRDALSSRVFKYVLMLTATPVQNRLWDLYSLIDLLAIAKGHPNPLGEPEEFTRNYSIDSGGKRLNPQKSDAFHAILRRYMVRTRRKDVSLNFPTREVKLLRQDPTLPEQNMAALVAKLLPGMRESHQAAVVQALLSSPQALAAELQSISTDSETLADATASVRAVSDRNPQTGKLQGLINLVRDLRKRSGKTYRLVVFTLRKQTQAAIGRALEAQGVRVGFLRRGQVNLNNKTAQLFRIDPPLINVVVCTDDAAEGVKLGAGNVMVNYDLPWDPILVEQRISRLQRVTSEGDRVEVINLITGGSAEDRVVAPLIQKIQSSADTIGDIEGLLESAGHEDEGSFQTMIRDLVNQALRGAEVDEAVHKQAGDLQRAHDLIARERQGIDGALGPATFRPDGNGRAPKLKLQQPSMSIEQFVLKALVAENAAVRSRQDETYDVERQGQPLQRITFKPQLAAAAQDGMFSDGAVLLCLPGQPLFDELVERWQKRSLHAVRHVSSPNADTVDELAAKWCKSIAGAKFVRAELLDKTAKGSVHLICKVRAANAIDSLEKIVISAPPDPHDAPPPEDVRISPIVQKPIAVRDMIYNSDDVIASTASGDSDIRAFRYFYDARLREELQHTTEDTGLRNRLEADGSTRVSTEIVGMSGYRYDLIKIRVWFTLDRTYEYSADIELLPSTGRILSEPTRELCSVTGKPLPLSCLAQCALSNRWAAAHLLVRSAASGRSALPSYSVKCAVSGELVLIDEVEESPLTGKKALKRYFKPSLLSGRAGLAEDFGLCSFTNVELLLDELNKSDLSGQLYRRDEQAACAATGRLGHRSEFQTCEATQALLAPDQITPSAISGRQVRRDLLIPSSKPPHRLGLAAETVTCAVTGKRLLTDEVFYSVVSTRPVDRDVAVISTLSGLPALPDEIVYCAKTHSPFLASETTESDVSRQRVDRRLLTASPLSGRQGLSEEFAQCEITGIAVLIDELVISDQSGRRFRHDQQMRSDESGKVGHVSELVTCALTGRSLLAMESAPSAISATLASRSLLVTSERSGRLGLPNESARCEQTGRSLLIDEVATSVVSGKTVDRELLVPSDLSGDLALPEELVTCAVTHQRLLPAETAASDYSGKVVRRDLLRVSPVSGRLGLEQEFAACDITSELVLSDELVVSEESGQRFRRDQAVASDESGRVAHRSEIETCGSSGAVLLASECGRSAVTGNTYSKRLLRASDKSPDRYGLESELVTCPKSGLRLLQDETDISTVSGLRVDKDLLVSSDRSGRLALEEELVTCEVTAQRLLPEEVGVSDVSNKHVSQDLLHTSPISGRLGLADEFDTCQITGVRLLRDELVTSEESGLRFRGDEAEASQESQRIGHRSEMVVCASTGLQVLKSETGVSAVTGKPHLIRLLLPSEKPPYRLGIESEIVICAQSGKRLLVDETAASAVSLSLVDKELLVASELSRTLALPAEMVRCAKTNRLVLPKETVVCSVSGLRVAAARSIVGLSAVSKKPALLEYFVTCDVTGQRLLPDELVECQITGKRVSPVALGVCKLSRKRVLKSMLVSSAMSGITFLAKFAVQSPVSQRLCAPKEALICTWSGDRMPGDEIATCNLTGLPVAKHYLNPEAELRSLRDLLDGREHGADSPDLAQWLPSRLGGQANHLATARVTAAADGKAYAVCAETRALLGLRVRYIGCVVSDREKSRELRGRILIGRRHRDGWAVDA